MSKPNCIECRYYLPSEQMFYNKPTGFCGNSRVGKPCRGLSPACAFFEPESPKLLEKISKLRGMISNSS